MWFLSQVNLRLSITSRHSMASWTAHNSFRFCDGFQSLWERPHNQGLQILWEAGAGTKLATEYLCLSQHFSYRDVLSKTIDVLERIWKIGGSEERKRGQRRGRKRGRRRGRRRGQRRGRKRGQKRGRRGQRRERRGGREEARRTSLST